MNYYIDKIKKISNISEYSIKNNNTNKVILEKLYAMKEIQLKINGYMTQLNNIVQNNENNNFPPIDNNKTEEFTKKYNDIETKYKEITDLLSKSIQDFKTKTLKDITELQIKILDLIEQIKKLVSDFKLKHDIFNDKNFANITLQISSLTNATNSKKYMDKLDEILKNLTKGINDNNNNISYVNAVNSLNSDSIVEFNKVYESDNNNIQSVNPSLSSSKLGNRIVSNENSEFSQVSNNRNKFIENANLSSFFNKDKQKEMNIQRAQKRINNIIKKASNNKTKNPSLVQSIKIKAKSNLTSTIKNNNTLSNNNKSKLEDYAKLKLSSIGLK